MANYKRLLQDYINKNIPAASAMKFTVEMFDDKKLVISACLEANINDKKSAFAGSIYSLAVLTGWGLIKLKLLSENIDADSAIHTGNIIYHKPVLNDFTAECSLTGDESYDKFLKGLKEKSNSKLSLSVKIIEKNDSERAVKAVLNAVYYSWIKKDIIE